MYLDTGKIVKYRNMGCSVPECESRRGISCKERGCPLSFLLMSVIVYDLQNISSEERWGLSYYPNRYFWKPKHIPD